MVALSLNSLDQSFFSLLYNEYNNCPMVMFLIAFLKCGNSGKLFSKGILVSWQVCTCAIFFFNHKSQTFEQGCGLDDSHYNHISLLSTPFSQITQPVDT